jgi:hypothetical protein
MVLNLCQSQLKLISGVTAALDWVGLEDSLVPWLCILTCTIHYTQWESTLWTMQWGLSYEQAVNRLNTMQCDIKAQQVQPVQVSP